MRLNLSDTISLMNSRDYRDRLVAEYIQTKIRWERLKAFCNRIEAAKLDPKLTEPEHHCSLELFRRLQSIMGEYLHQLEICAVIEDIDLEDATMYLCDRVERERETRCDDVPFSELEDDAAIIREAVARVIRSCVLLDEDDERVFCACLNLMDELIGAKRAETAADIAKRTCCQTDTEPPCEREIYGESEGS